MKHEIQIDILEKMFQTVSSNDILRSAIKVLIPKRKQKKVYIIVFVLSIIPSYMISVSQDTVPIFRNCVQIVNDVCLALFGIIFTGYALFQALIGKEMLIRMIQSTVIKDKEEISKLQETNENFAETMMLEFLCIVISLLLLLILNSLPDDYCMFQKLYLNNIIAGLGMYIYFYLFFIVLLEIKSFIFNIVQLFNFHAGTRIMEIMKENRNE